MLSLVSIEPIGESARVRRTCRIFIKTTPSLFSSMLTNFACVTASAIFSIVLGADLLVGSGKENNYKRFNLQR